MPSTINRKYGWIRDPLFHLTDPSLFYQVPPEHTAKLPAAVDLRPAFASIPVYDQGQLGSCTANAWAGLMQYLRMEAKRPNLWAPSRLFIYYGERAFLNSVTTDSGATVASGALVLTGTGVCPETEWPYDPTQFAVKPPAADYKAAKPHMLVHTSPLNNLSLVALKSCLASKLPFVIGFTVFQSFESQQVADTGVVPMPSPESGDTVIGDHSVVCVGYNTPSNVFICRNSWGAGWGQAGYFTIPIPYLCDSVMATDFHMAKSAT